MKKLLNYQPGIAMTAVICIGCNNATEDTSKSTTDSLNASSHAQAGDTSMTDSNRNMTTGQGNDMAAMSDTGFISKNIMDNNMEIAMGKMENGKGTNKDAKKVAAEIISDHTAMNKDLKALASKKQMTGPGENAMPPMPAMDAAGKDFDKMWVAEMIKGHDAKIAELQGVINNAKDADIKMAAQKALPKVQKHKDDLAKLNMQ